MIEAVRSGAWYLEKVRETESGERQLSMLRKRPMDQGSRKLTDVPHFWTEAARIYLHRNLSVIVSAGHATKDIPVYSVKQYSTLGVLLLHYHEWSR